MVLRQSDAFSLNWIGHRFRYASDPHRDAVRDPFR
jgi:hypothetical protein